MSEQTKAALEDAIAAHVADEYLGDLVSAWVVIAETSSIEMLGDGAGMMVVDARDMQSAYLTTGLIYSALTQEPDNE